MRSRRIGRETPLDRRSVLAVEIVVKILDVHTHDVLDSYRLFDDLGKQILSFVFDPISFRIDAVSIEQNCACVRAHDDPSNRSLIELLALELGLDDDTRPAHGTVIRNTTHVVVCLLCDGPVAVCADRTLVPAGRADERRFASIPPLGSITRCVLSTNGIHYLSLEDGTIYV